MTQLRFLFVLLVSFSVIAVVISFSTQVGHDYSGIPLGCRNMWRPQWCRQVIIPIYGSNEDAPFGQTSACYGMAWRPEWCRYYLQSMNGGGGGGGAGGGGCRNCRARRG
ncbi:hypothetical protein AAVH_18825 [Aphelenchoides avenae]|nr:hypothetical protein AAVH_18825 [Aphelenchus avenae]